MRTITGFRSALRLAVFAVALALSAGLLEAQRTLVPAKADARTVAHVLDRITFGPRPGDVARVQEMGLSAYIDQQLHPERIADVAMKARLSEFETINMTSSQLADNIFNPVDAARREQQQAQAKAEAQQQAKAVTSAVIDPTMTTTAGVAAAKPPAPGTPPPPPQLTAEQRQLQQKAQSVPQELMQAKMLRASLSDRQLEEVLVDFWFNHFNVFIGKGQVRNYLTEYEREAIRPYVLGNFRDMLGATAHSPAMLFYLDNFQSRAPGSDVNGLTRGQVPNLQQRLADPRLTPQQREQVMARLNAINPNQKRPMSGINENYARELMELHTLGVDGGYTQADVIEVAKILTGWTIDRPQQGGEFVYRPQWHVEGSKTVMGKTFAAAGEKEGERLLDFLALHEKTAHHIAFQLSQRFVSDNPPPALVDRVAKKFLDTKGDLRETTRAILTSPEFMDPKYFGAKMKTPLEFVVSAVRATNANIVNAQPMVQVLNQLGMPLYGAQPPTGYSMTADAWVNTGALLARMNFGLQLVGLQAPARPAGPGRGGLPPPPGAAGANGQPPPVRPAQQQAQLQNQAARQQAKQVGLPPPGPGQRLGGPPNRAPISVDVRSIATDTTEESVDRTINALLASGASDATRQILAKAQSPQQLVALTLGCPEFQKR
jgi:uncharacterized protein (DUF1800 family)